MTTVAATGICKPAYTARAAGRGSGGGSGDGAATPTVRLVDFVFFVSRDVQAACAELGDVQVRVDVAKALPP